MTYRLIELLEVDRDWAYALKSEAYREVVERQFGPWDDSFQRELFKSRWKPAISRAIVVGEERVGFVAFVDSDDQCWIDEIQISHEWRGRGIGSAVLRDLIAQAHQSQKPVRLQVLKENHWARALYGRLGFVPNGETATHIVMICFPA